MAAVDVAVTSSLSPERAWSLASNLGRFDEWLTIFGGWKSPVPDEIDVDTQVSSLIKVKASATSSTGGLPATTNPRKSSCSATGAAECASR